MKFIVIYGIHRKLIHEDIKSLDITLGAGWAEEVVTDVVCFVHQKGNCGGSACYGAIIVILVMLGEWGDGELWVSPDAHRN